MASKIKTVKELNKVIDNFNARVADTNEKNLILYVYVDEVASKLILDRGPPTPDF